MEFDASYLLGFRAGDFRQSPQDCFSRDVSDRLNNLIDKRVKGNAQGDRNRDWHWTASKEMESLSMLVPICNASFDYKGVEYRIWLDGIAGNKCAGDLPEDSGKKFAAWRGFLPGIATLLAMPVAGSLSGIGVIEGFSGRGLIAVIITLGYGVLRRLGIISHSRKIRQQSLAGGGSRLSKPILARSGRDLLVLPLLSMIGIWVAGGQPYDLKIQREESVRQEEVRREAMQKEQEAKEAASKAALQKEQEAKEIASKAALKLAKENAETERLAHEEESRAAISRAIVAYQGTDCSQPSSRVEKQICASDELRKLENEIFNSYRRAATNAADMELLIQEQTQWRQDLINSGKDKNGINFAMHYRITQLSNRR